MFQRRVPQTFFVLVLCLLAIFLLQDIMPALSKSESAAPQGDKTLELEVTAPENPLEFGEEGLLTLSVTNTDDETAVNVTVKLPNNRSLYYTGDIAEPDDVVTRATVVFGDIAPDQTVIVDVPIQIRGVPAQGAAKLNLVARGDGGVKSKKEKIDIEIVPFEPEETEMPEEGGEFVPESGNVVFDFPPDWLDRDADITYEAQEKFIIEDDETGSVITFEVDAQTNGPPVDEFSEPVTVTFAVDNLVDISTNPTLIVRTKEKKE